MKKIINPEATYYCFSREKAEKEFHFLPYEVKE